VADLFEAVSAGKLEPVYVITSEQPLLVDRAVRALLEASVPPAMRGFNYDVIEGKATGSRIVAAAQTLPMMAQRRMVLVRDLAVIAAAELTPLIEYLASPNPSTVLVLLTSKLDKRIKFYAAAAKAGKVHELWPPKNLVPWIRAEAQARGAKLEPDAVSRLAEAVGGDLARLALSIDQLSLYAGDRAVTVDDVEDLVADTRERSIFELTDSLGAGDLTRSLAAVGALCDQRQSGVGVVVMLARHVRQLALCQVAIAERTPRNELPSLIGAPPFVIDRIMQSARHWTPAALARASVRLSEADRTLKGQMPMSKTLGKQMTERLVLDRLVSDLVTLGAPPQKQRGA
jgi:DNA polymerase III subunit delta